MTSDARPFPHPTRGSLWWLQPHAFAWLLAPIALHLGFSWIGFSPTDDGWLPAISRRLIEGEVPYRDFIFVFPALSAWMQVPLVLFGGDHVIWLSRLWGWLTLGGACWIWSGILLPGLTWPLRYLAYVLALLCCAHTFPVMAWHSIDGILLSTIAVRILYHDTQGRRRTAFFIAGLAALCRQNFAFFPPLLLLATGGRPSAWFAAGFWSALPGLIYVAGFAALGAAPALFHQISAAGGAFRWAAFDCYATNLRFWSGLAGGLIAAGVLPWISRQLSLRTGAVSVGLFILISLTIAWCLWRGPGPYIDASFPLFGFVLGLAAPAPWRRWGKSDRLVLTSVLGLAWVTAISVGYNSPSLLSGVLLLAGWRLLQIHLGVPSDDAPVTVASCAFTVVAVCLAFSHARLNFPYRDRPQSQLAFDAGTALKGASGLRTNELTHATLVDLQTTIGRLESEGRRYAILTDCSAAWIRSKQPNPLPCEWPQETSLGRNRALFLRYFVAISRMPSDSRILVQKFLIAEYNHGQFPIPKDSSYYWIQNWIARYCVKAGDTPFFELYLPPPAGTFDAQLAK